MDHVTQLALFVLMPVLAVILLALVFFLALRGGKPFKFDASGFGVSVRFSSATESKLVQKESSPHEAQGS